MAKKVEGTKYCATMLGGRVRLAFKAKGRAWTSLEVDFESDRRALGVEKTVKSKRTAQDWVDRLARKRREEDIA